MPRTYETQIYDEENSVVVSDILDESAFMRQADGKYALPDELMNVVRNRGDISVDDLITARNEIESYVSEGAYMLRLVNMVIDDAALGLDYIAVKDVKRRVGNDYDRIIRNDFDSAIGGRRLRDVIKEIPNTYEGQP